MSSTLDLFYAYKILKSLTKPWRKWDAYDMGVIDETGYILLPEKDRSSRQKKAFTKIDLLCRNLKRLIERLPGGKSKIVSYSVALKLLTEQDQKTKDEDAPANSTGNIAGVDMPLFKPGHKKRKKKKRRY